MDIWVYGAGKRCEQLMVKLERYPDVHVKGIADSFLKGEKFGFPIVNLLDKNLMDCPKDSVIVITLSKLKETIKVAKRLHENGYYKIYLYLGKAKSFLGFLEGECKKIFENMDYVLPSLEIHVVDYCNLNCAGCVHFSPLFPKENPTFDTRINDLKVVKKLFDNILVLSLLGGEPLLNPDICRYMKAAREIFPDTEIQLITNGLLLPRMGREFFQCAHEDMITIVISEYKPTSYILESIINSLELENVEYTIRRLESKLKFNRPLSLRKESVYEKCCMSDGCTAVCDGRIARCPTLLYINQFNTFFKEKLPQIGIYRLEDFRDGRELMNHLEERVPLCDYCIRDDMEWHPCAAEIKMKDFAVLQ